MGVEEGMGIREGGRGKGDRERRGKNRDKWMCSITLPEIPTEVQQVLLPYISSKYLDIYMFLASQNIPASTYTYVLFCKYLYINNIYIFPQYIFSKITIYLTRDNRVFIRVWCTEDLFNLLTTWVVGHCTL